jgi:gliding motility-associated-like protein
VDIIAADNACPLPLLDTIRLVVYIEPPPNGLPGFDTLSNTLNYRLNAGDILNLDLTGSDPDGDSLVFSVINPAGQPDYDFNFNPEYPRPDRLQLGFYWEADCYQYDFSEFRDFHFLLLLEDKDFCRILHPDTLRMNIHVELPANASPVIDSDNIGQPAELHILDSLIFNIHATDPDQDRINVYAAAEDFELAGNGFTPFIHTATGSLTAPFGWKLECNTLDPTVRNEFLIHFIVEDEDQCRTMNADTLSLRFKALLPENRPPALELLNVSSLPVEVFAGDSIHILMKGTDADADSIYITLLDPSGKLETAGIDFNPAQGLAEITASLLWQTDCRHIHPDGEPARYDCRIVIRDNKCLVPEEDTLSLTINVKNREVNYEALFIPNVFTPNADGFNDYFTVDNLPEDNCDHSFQSVSIYNRDGREVFFTREREFRWYAQNVENGIYYYHIQYTGRDYKGYLHVLY